MPHGSSGPRTCPAVDAIRRGGAPAPDGGGCPSECQTYHTVAYLERCIEEGAAPADLDELLRHDSSYVRRLCQIIAEQHGVAVRSMARDPAHEIRAAHLRTTAELDDLVEAADDESRAVRRQILRRLQPGGASCMAPPIAVPGKRQEQVLMRLHDYINDKDHTVRLEFVRALRAFPDLPPKFVARLFDKKNIGLFVLGAEDEMAETRRELVLSIETFFGEATAGVIFEYLVDMLSDEAEVVREAVVQMLQRLSARCRLTAGASQLSFILGGLDEDNSGIRDGILELISNLCYETVDVYHQLASQRSIEPVRMLKALGRLVRRNRALFRENIASVYRYCVFDENPRAAGSARRLYDTEYLARLAVLRVLLRHYKIDVTLPVRRDLAFLRLRLSGGPRGTPPENAEAARGIAVQALREGLAWSERLFAGVDMGDPAALYFVELCRSGMLWLASGDGDALCRFAYTHVVQDDAGGLAPRGPVLRLCAASAHPSRDDILRCLAGPCGRAVVSEFIVSVPNEVYVHVHTGALVRFEALAFYSYSTPAMKLVVCSPRSDALLTYGLARKLRVVVDDCPEELLCYIATWHDGRMVRLSSTYDIRVLPAGSAPP